jgi:hypothetical protein
MLLRRVRQPPDRRPILIATPLYQSRKWCTTIAVAFVIDRERAVRRQLNNDRRFKLVRTAHVSSPFRANIQFQGVHRVSTTSRVIAANVSDAKPECPMQKRTPTKHDCLKRLFAARILISSIPPTYAYSSSPRSGREDIPFASPLMVHSNSDGRQS